MLVRRVGFEPTDRWLSTNEVCLTSRHRRTFQIVEAHRLVGRRGARFQRSEGPGGNRTHLYGFADRHLTSRALDLKHTCHCGRCAHLHLVREVGFEPTHDSF
jgi:hypothetical protein